ncbi:MAG: diacylglycerol kinase family protein, partial [Candidatus Kariarchaeaceae archaeon]
MDQSILFVVNPESKAGKTGKTWDKTYEQIRSHLKGSYDYVIADGRGKGIEATMDGIQAGYNTIVSVGGEGSNNEVANGVINSGKDVTL